MICRRSPFTTREIQVLRAMADGLACREIARLLAISEHTVRKHRSNMLTKLDLRNAPPRLIAYVRGQGWLPPAPGPQRFPLSVREDGVLMLVIEGHTSKEVARRLGISPATVRKHRENLLRKLGLHSTAQLVAFATNTRPEQTGC